MLRLAPAKLTHLSVNMDHLILNLSWFLSTRYQIDLADVEHNYSSLSSFRTLRLSKSTSLWPTTLTKNMIANEGKVLDKDLSCTVRFDCLVHFVDCFKDIEVFWLLFWLSDSYRVMIKMFFVPSTR